MRILVIAAAFPPARAGEADHALLLCERLAALSFDVHVLTGKCNQADGRSFQVHASMPDWGWSNLPRFTRLLRSCSPDAVLLLYTPRDYNHNDMMIYAPSIAKRVVPRARFVTQFLTALIGPQGSRLVRAMRKALAVCVGKQRLDYVFGTLLSQSDHVITLSEQHLSALLSGFPDLHGKSSALPPPPLLRMCAAGAEARERGRALLGMKPDDFLLAYYGYMYQEKGIETLIQALPMLTSQRAVHLVIIGGNPGQGHGPAYVESLKSTARKLGVSNRIIWSGEYASDSDEASLYLHAADAGVFPFKYGVTLNRSSIAAAAAHGLPIVTTRGAVLESAFIDRENVLLCAPQDAPALARAINSLVGDPQLRYRLSSGAWDLSRRYFSWDKAVQETVQALRGQRL